VAFQVQSGLEGLVDRLDGLPQRLEQARTGPFRLASTSRSNLTYCAARSALNAAPQ
jgi:hypothetical protein